MTPSLYFAPTFFSPFYFPPLSPPGSGVSELTVLGYRDRDAYAAIIAALVVTGEFAEVVFGCPIDHTSIGADRFPLAVIVPSDWAEVDDVDPTVNVRRVTYTLTLVVRDEEAGQRFQLLDRLTSVVQDAIDGADLNGGCLGALTKLRRGRFESRPKHPEQWVVLTGEFAYLVPTEAGHDTSD
jgi:hypothetical protein